MNDKGWTAAIIGLRLKLIAVLLLAGWLTVLATIVLANPTLFTERGFQLTVLVSFCVAVALDAAGRIFCLATPETAGSRVPLILSVVAQIVSIVLIALPFVVDRDVDFALKFLAAALPAFAAQCLAAFLFMSYTKNVAVFLGRPDLEVVPGRVLVAYGLAGSSAAAITFVVAAFLFVFLLCGGCCVGTPFAAILIDDTPPSLAYPIVFGILGLAYFAFWQYGSLMYRMEKAIRNRGRNGDFTPPTS